MAEPRTEIIREEQYEEEEQNDALSHLPNTSLAELNLVLVLLSAFSFSIDDCMEDEVNDHNASNQVVGAKTCTPRLQTKKRNIHETKLDKRSSLSSRFQTTIRDSRHGRKM